jgi:hypothetical protein
MTFNSRLLSESRLSVFLSNLASMEKQEYPDESDAASTISSFNFPTPTHSTRSDETATNRVEEVTPWAGESFVIREKDTHLTIALVRGKLLACQGVNGYCGYQWDCVEKNGWLGFRNSVSGTYLGRDDDLNLKANVYHHMPWEYFCARRHPEGGYILMVKCDDDLLSIAVTESGTLFATHGEGTRWEFVRASDFNLYSTI